MKVERESREGKKNEGRNRVREMKTRHVNRRYTMRATKKAKRVGSRMLEGWT